MKTILIIEDEPETRENLVLMLEMEGFKPISAANGREGVKLAKGRQPDMPEMDGHAVLEALRADESTVSIPFIFLTARGDKKDLREGRRNVAALKLSNLLQIDRFEEDLNISRVQLYAPKPPPPPPIPSAPPPTPEEQEAARQRALQFLAKLRAEQGL